MATLGAGPKIGRGFVGTQVRPFIPFAASSATPMILGAACGALAVCGLQYLMVVLSEIDIDRSVETSSE